MIRRGYLAAGAAALLLLSGCDRGGGEGGSAGAAAGSGAPKVVRFSVLPTENSANLRTLWAPFFEDMGRLTGLKVEPVYASNYTALVTAMAADQIDAGWFSNASGLEAVRRGGGEVFARSSDPSGVDGYQSVLIVNTRSPITLDQVLRCDRTLDFGLGDARSTSGTLAPVTYLFAPRRIEPERCFATVRSANHEANLLSVANGVLDVATNNSTNLKRLAAARPETGARVKVIWTSHHPRGPIVRRKDLDPRSRRSAPVLPDLWARAGPRRSARRGDPAHADFGTFRPRTHPCLCARWKRPSRCCKRATPRPRPAQRARPGRSASARDRSSRSAPGGPARPRRSRAHPPQ
jgi:phosphonate transport system substrate-binding protein